MKKLSLTFAMLIIVALTLGACAGGASPAPSGGAKPAPTEVSRPAEPTQPPAGNSNAGSSVPSTSSNTNDNHQLELKDVTEGLDSLNSYQSSFSMSFEGKEGGQSKSSTFQSVEEFVKNPPAKRTTITGMGALASGSQTNPDNNLFQTIEVGGKQYVVWGTTCFSSDSAEAPKATATFKPSDVIGNIRGAQFVGNEDVNGVPTAHYKGDTQGLSVLGYLSANSDVWVAQQGNYVVKYTLQATGKDQFFGNSNTEGTITWTYEVKDINQPITIEAPKNCGGTAEDIPIMADAKNKSSLGGMSTYTSASKFEDVVAFYDKEMKSQGWTEETKGGLSAEGVAQKSYTKDTRTVQIMITADQSSGGTSVIIQEGTK